MHNAETIAAPTAVGTEPEEPRLAEAEQEEHGLAEFVPEKVRKPGEIVFSILAMMIGILGFYFALDMSSDTNSSPSVFPKIASIVIASCGLLITIQAVRREAPPAGSSAFAYLLPRDVLVMLIMLLAYCVVLPIIHFIPASYIFMVVGMVYLNRGKKIVPCLIYSAIALVVLVLLFRYLFLVILP